MSASLDTIFAALSDPTRRAILSMLLEDDMAVTDVAAGFDISLAAISKHLGTLARAGLITQERRGRVVWCKLEPDALRDASVWMQGFGQFDGPDMDALETLLAGMTPRPAVPGELLAELLLAETAAWQGPGDGAVAINGPDAGAPCLHVDADGPVDITAPALRVRGGGALLGIDLTEGRVAVLAEDLALLTCRADLRRAGTDAIDSVWLSTLWRRAGHGWIAAFRQQTPANR